MDHLYSPVQTMQSTSGSGSVIRSVLGIFLSKILFFNSIKPLALLMFSKNYSAFGSCMFYCIHVLRSMCCLLSLVRRVTNQSQYV
jgi:hypothetical protein